MTCYFVVVGVIRFPLTQQLDMLSFDRQILQVCFFSLLNRFVQCACTCSVEICAISRERKHYNVISATKMQHENSNRCDLASNRLLLTYFLCVYEVLCAWFNRFKFSRMAVQFHFSATFFLSLPIQHTFEILLSVVIIAILQHFWCTFVDRNRWWKICILF